MDYWRMQPEEIFSSLGSSKDGLSSREAKERLQKYGMNEIEREKRKSAPLIFISQFHNPLIYILLVTTILAFFLGDGTEAVIIFIILFINGALGFIQEYRSEKALEEVRKYTSPTIHVLRDGHAAELHTKYLVPGDIILLSRGDIIPADARILESFGMEVNESILTDESMPVEKNAAPIQKASPAMHQLSNTLFMGSTVTEGHGKAMVTSTGKNALLGKTAEKVKTTPLQTNFENSIREFGGMLLQLILVMTAFIFLVNSFLGHGWLESLLFALAIAVGITPGLLPVIITIGLSGGAMRLLGKHVAVRRLDAIEDLGDMDILCADKTGTLTENSVSLVKHVDCMGNENEKILLYSLVCSSALVHNGRIKGGTIDSAIWAHALKGFPMERLKEYSRIETIPFDYGRKRMGVVAQHAEGRLLISKGDPESVIPSCAKALVSGKELPISSYSSRLHKQFEDFSSEGYRVIAVAYKKIGKKESYSEEDEGEMVFMGFLTLFDEPKKDALPALEHFRHMGVEVYVLTGDGLAVTAEVCRQVGVEVKGGRILAGPEIGRMGGEELRKKVETHNIYARLTASQKLMVVEALKSNGHVVGFVGDSADDAPALRAADVGIAVKGGADVAREASDIILLRKSLNVIANGIAEGRKTFSNMKKYIHNTISANFGNMFSLSISSLFLPFIPLLPSQILLTNLLSDIPLLSVSTDNVDKEELKKPRRLEVGKITRLMVFFGLISSAFDIITMAFLFFILGADAALFRTLWFLESVLSEMLVVFAIRTQKPIYKSMPSMLLMGLTAAGVFLSIGVIFSPLAPFLEFAPITLPMVGLVVAIVLGYVLVVELAKRYFYSKYGA